MGAELAHYLAGAVVVLVVYQRDLRLRLAER